jgi:hypothetical protein
VPKTQTMPIEFWLKIILTNARKKVEKYFSRREVRCKDQSRTEVALNGVRPSAFVLAEVIFTLCFLSVSISGNFFSRWQIKMQSRTQMA